MPMEPTHDPELMGNYELDERLATGRLVNVYRATSLRSGVPVCLKVLRPEAANDAPVRDRFIHSARSLLGVQLPNVVTVRDVGDVDGRPFIVTDLIAGTDLGRVVSRGGPLRTGAAIRYLIQAASGLDAVAGLGHLHGDLRPGHLLMSKGTIFVVGFGRCVSWNTAQGRRVWGDPAYLAPEVAGGRQPDVRADIYALGCTFFELVTSRPPFGAGPPDAMLACHAHEPFPSARSLAPQVADPFDDLLRRMGSKNANQRPQNYPELIKELQLIGPAISAGTARPPILAVEAGRQAGQQVEIPEGQFLLGRTPGEGFEIDDGRISRRHAMLHRAGNRVVLEDLGSRNGVKVNGTRSERVTLRPGDRIRIGDTVLRVDNVEGDGEVESISVEGAPSSPVRGAFGASEVSHAPQHQIRVMTLDADDVVPAHFRAVAHLATSLAREVTDRTALALGALNAAREVIAADEAVVVPIEHDAPKLEAKNADEAQTLSCVLPAVERALPGRLSLLTSVRVGRDGSWGVALAPIHAGQHPSAFLVLVRRSGAFEPEVLAALELLADVLALTTGDDAEPITQAMSTPVRPSSGD